MCEGQNCAFFKSSKRAVFLPIGSSRKTPAHSPGPNFVSPARRLGVAALAEGQIHGLINNIGTKAKFRHKKKLTSKVTLRQVYRLEIQSLMLAALTVFLVHHPQSPFPV